VAKKVYIALMERKQTPPVVAAADRYLDEAGHSQASYEHVNHVLGAFEFAVKLATSRALEKLETTPREPTEAIIIPFPRQPNSPEGAA